MKIEMQLPSKGKDGTTGVARKKVSASARELKIAYSAQERPSTCVRASFQKEQIPGWRPTRTA